jgi:hypothetical protein
METNSLSHTGVLGMRWGRRNGQLTRKNTSTSGKRQRDLDKEELNKLQNKKGFRTTGGKKLDAEKIKILKERVNSVKKEKLSSQEQNAIIRSRTKKASLAVLALFVLGDMPRVVGHNAKVLAGIYKQQRKYEKYGGFNPKKVVNGRWRDAVDSSAVDIGKKLLGAG